MHSTYRELVRGSRGPVSGRALAVAGAVLLAVGACRDLEPPAAPAMQAVGAQAAGRGPIFEPEFDRYTARVVLTMTGGGMKQVGTLPERRVEYDIERKLDQGEWITTYDFGGGIRDNGQLHRIPIRKVVAGLDGMKYYDHNGALIPLAAQRPVVEGQGQFPDLTAPDASRRGRGAGAAPGASGRNNARGWAGSLVVTPEHAVRQREQLGRAFERAAARGRTVRFRKERGEFVTEIVLDTTRGTIEETRVSRRGHFSATTKYEYDDLGENRWLRVRSVQRQDDPGNDRNPLTVEQVLMDQRFTRGEGR